MNFKIKNKFALVTGASRGIGEEICRSLAKEGAKIIACSRNKKDLKKLISSLPNSNKHFLINIDLSNNLNVKKLIKIIKNKKIQPDIIVNNLGGNLGFTNPLGSSEEWRKVMFLNTEVAIEINRSFIPNMIKKKWGRICHISSISAIENQGPPAYCASKAALNAYVRSLARYVAEKNVILTSVMPGAVFTKGGYWDKQSKKNPKKVKKYLAERMAIKRFGKVNEISEIVKFLCSDQASFFVGSNVLVDGGQGRSFF
tara:strand:- start:186 stop:953 length:768 start_codon:yes stop_codon:yes gene_type:complete